MVTGCIGRILERQFFGVLLVILYIYSHFIHYSDRRHSPLRGSKTAQQASIWFQIFLSAFVPIILLFLALYITQSIWIAHLTAWISIFHLGMVLASTYFLTEAVSLIPFYLFLLYFYRSFSAIFEESHKHSSWKKDIILAAIMLAIYAWFRPMGQFVAILGSLIVILFSQDPLKLKCKKIALLLITFFTCVSPWYFRNYQLTGNWFFCPMFGAYLNSFCAPRIKAEIENKDLIDAWRELGTQAELTYRQQAPRYKKVGIALPKEICVWRNCLAYIFGSSLACTL